MEEVGFRSTRIRSVTNSLITVPNSKITSCTIDNYGKRKMRLFKTMVGLRYDTPVEKMEEYVQALREILASRTSIVQDTVYIYFTQMGSFSLDILVQAFFLVPDRRTELVEKESILLEFMRAAQRIDVGFAFPTQTLEIEKFPTNTLATPAKPE